jgi:hypothetical protein
MGSLDLSIGTFAFSGNTSGEVLVRGDVAYVTGGPAGLHVVDVADPASPRLLGTMGTPYVADGVSAGEEFVAISIGVGPESGQGRLLLLRPQCPPPGEGRGVAPPARTFDAPAVLETVSPNPFRGAARLTFRLERPGHATLAVHDVSGRVVRILVEGEAPAGSQNVTWDGRGPTGLPVAAGTYFVCLRVGESVSSRRIVALGR